VIRLAQRLLFNLLPVVIYKTIVFGRYLFCLQFVYND